MDRFDNIPETALAWHNEGKGAALATGTELSEVRLLSAIHQRNANKRLAELMGGEVGVESEPGAGSTFWWMDVKARERTRTANSAAAGAATELTFRGTSIEWFARRSPDGGVARVGGPGGHQLGVGHGCRERRQQGVQGPADPGVAVAEELVRPLPDVAAIDQ